MDDRLRALRREALRGDPGAEVRLLRAREQAGELRDDAVAIAAHLGHRPARELLGWLAAPAVYGGGLHERLDDAEWTVENGARREMPYFEWARTLCTRWAPEYAMRAAVALGSAIIGDWEDGLMRRIENAILTGSRLDRRQLVHPLGGVWLLVAGVVQPTRVKYVREKCLEDLLLSEDLTDGYGAVRAELLPYIFNQRDPISERQVRSTFSPSP